MESQFNSGSGGASGAGGMGRFAGVSGAMGDAFGTGGDFDQDRDIMGGGSTEGGEVKKVPVNLEDAVLEEQKLFQILEVSHLFLIYEPFSI